MKFLELTQNRFSCRSYLSKEIEPEKLAYIMECVRMAPSACNRQPWMFHIVKTEEGRQQLQRCYDREWFKTAPLYLIASVKHDEEWVRGDGKQHGNIDVAIAVEHLCLAAAEQGLGTCWVCNFDTALCRQLFSLPDTEEPAVLIPLGYPACEPTSKNRKAIEEIMAFNQLG